MSEIKVSHQSTALVLNTETLGIEITAHGETWRSEKTYQPHFYVNLSLIHICSIFIGNVLSRIDLYDCTVAAGTMERDTGRACITACCRDARRTFCYIQKAETFVK